MSVANANARAIPPRDDVAETIAAMQAALKAATDTVALCTEHGIVLDALYVEARTPILEYGVVQLVFGNLPIIRARFALRDGPSIVKARALAKSIRASHSTRFATLPTGAVLTWDMKHEPQEDQTLYLRPVPWPATPDDVAAADLYRRCQAVASFIETGGHVAGEDP